jgi:DnaK suppressor protein
VWVEPIQERLLAERRRTQRRLAELTGDFREIVEASQATNADDEHDPEGATIAFERSQVATLTRQAARQLEEIDAALERLAAGSYGTCERCGRGIAPERLDVRPTARTCVTC